MEKKLLGVRRKKPIKRSKKKFLKKVVDYLKSDCYIYAPLISSPSSVVSLPKMAAVIENEKPIKEKKKRLLEEFWEYIKSDSYMYANMMVPQSSHVPSTKLKSPSSGTIYYLKRVSVTTSISTRTTEKHIQPNEQQAEVMPVPSKDCPSETRNREKVKRMVYQNCRSSSLPAVQKSSFHKEEDVVVGDYWII